MYIQRTKRPIKANTDVDVDVAPEATDLLFEADDVAELVAEVTGQDVTVEVDDEAGDVTFTVADEDFTVTPEEDTPLVEASTRILRGSKKTVSASTKLRQPARQTGRTRTIKRASK